MDPLEAAWERALESDAGVEESAIDDNEDAQIHEGDADDFSRWFSDSADEAPAFRDGSDAAPEPDALGPRPKARGRPAGTRGSADLRQFIEDLPDGRRKI